MKATSLLYRSIFSNVVYNTPVLFRTNQLGVKSIPFPDNAFKTFVPFFSGYDFQKSVDDSAEVLAKRKINTLNSYETRRLVSKLFNVSLDQCNVRSSRLIYRQFERRDDEPVIQTIPMHVDSTDVSPVSFSLVFPIIQVNCISTISTRSRSITYNPLSEVVVVGQVEHGVTTQFYGKGFRSCVVWHFHEKYH